MRVREVMTSAPVSSNPDAKVDLIAKLMLDQNCGEIPICEDGKVIGVVTDRDIACRSFAVGRKNPLDVTAREIMTRNVYTISPDNDVSAALQMMEENKVRRLPVTENGNLVGIVSVADFTTHVPESLVGQLVTAVSLPTIEVAVPAP